MNPKILEISDGQNWRTKTFEIVEVQTDTFMLKSKDSHVGLLGTLNKWLKHNSKMGDYRYRVMLWERSSSMRPVLGEGMTSDFNVDLVGMNESVIENAPSSNLESMVEKAD